MKPMKDRGEWGVKGPKGPKKRGVGFGVKRGPGKMGEGFKGGQEKF
jgi:hypothetical protein